MRLGQLGPVVSTFLSKAGLMTSENVSFSLPDDLQLDSTVLNLFELVPNLHFFIKDRSGRLVHCNETHRREILRYEPASTIYGKGNYDFFPNALAVSFAEDDRRVIDSGEPLIERVELNIASSGSLCWFCTSKFPARNSQDQVVGLFGISRRLQIADRRLREYELLMPSINHIHDHITETIQVSELAELCDMTEVTFRREFRKLFRMTPLKFIIRLRIHRACARLSESANPVGIVASECGFDDQNYFTRQFRNVMSMTPSEFRKRHRIPGSKG